MLVWRKKKEMRIKDADLNVFMPKAQRVKLIKEVNEALETMDRVNDQIKIWDIRNISEIYTQQMRDELQFLKEGKV